MDRMDSIQGLSCRILKERSLKPFRAISAANTEVALLQQAGGAKVSTSKVGIPSRLRVLTAAARSINESSSAREIEF